MQWKYVKDISEDTILEVEKRYHVKLPNSLKKVILERNGGRPENRLFCTENKKEKILKSLISYNSNDKENIDIYDGIFAKGCIPFAIAEFGDVICIKENGKIYIWLHELDKFEYVCNDIDQFLNNLYDEK